MTYSGRMRTVRTAPIIAEVKQVMDEDSIAEIGDGHPVSSCRRNVLGISKSSWSRISKDLHYHPYKPVRCQELKQTDFVKRRTFCTWLLERTEEDLESILFSDEASFELNGKVNSQNVRRYALLKCHDAENGGRPHHFVDKQSITPKVSANLLLNRR